MGSDPITKELQRAERKTHSCSMEKRMKIGLIQIGANEEKEKSLALAEEYITNAAKSGAPPFLLAVSFSFFIFQTRL